MNKYRPTSGEEGRAFWDEYCHQCIHERWTHFQEEDKDEDKCDIMTRSFLYDLNDPEYPIEWTFDDKGNGICTKFCKWDWGSDDDRNEPPPKPEPPSNDPNQLLMPFDIWELLGITDEITVTKCAIIETEILNNF